MVNIVRIKMVKWHVQGEVSVKETDQDVEDDTDEINRETDSKDMVMHTKIVISDY